MKLINADKVIEKLKEHKSLFCKNRDEFRALSDKDKARVDEIDTCIAELVNAEEVQTTDTDSDTISRAKAIEAIEAEKIAHGQYLTSSYVGYEFAEDAIRKLPPAQPAQLEQCPIYGGMCCYPSDQCYNCPRHAGAKMEREVTT